MYIYVGFALALIAVLAFLFYYLKLVKQKNRMIALLKKQNDSFLVAQKELLEAKAKAEESDRLKSAFLANMSHEIRTPLNAIMGFSSLMQDSFVEDEEHKQFVTIIHNNSTKLLSLMDEIFDIAQIESGVVQMQTEPCQVNELLMSLVTFFNLEKSLNGKDSIQIRVHKANKDTGFTINTDPKKLRQTLFNLIENALKYTNEGNIEIGYNLKETGMVEFYVRDTGIGFPQEKLDILFQRFRQADDSNSRQFGGIGLGLTLSQKFIKLMGGEMRAESVQGVGSVFYASLPYKQISE
ncbi:MAG: hypothetical protein CVU14_05355 [Bacteroidetes bacterium HGW-Bacteroidetes-9]|jgi:signal transduction histidine kinase|nr:MAG: hypothetical protein CVU14_05355 [Bacteroidetes bacterium HGW-Bacteroidetes-9]